MLRKYTSRPGTPRGLLRVPAKYGIALRRRRRAHTEVCSDVERLCVLRAKSHDRVFGAAQTLRFEPGWAETLENHATKLDGQWGGHDGPGNGPIPNRATEGARMHANTRMESLNHTSPLLHPSPSWSARDVTFFILDDHPVISFAMQGLIRSRPGWQVAGHASHPADAIAQIEKTRPDVLLLDLVFAGETGLDCLNRVRALSPMTRTVVYSVQPVDVYGARCLDAGAMGYLQKDAPVDVVLRALESVIDGRRWMGDAQWTEDPRARSSKVALMHLLSNRELEVLQLVTQGMSNREIAKALCRSIKTVETHRHRIARKLGVRGGAQLIRMAIHCLDGITINNGQGKASEVRAHPDHDAPSTPTH